MGLKKSVPTPAIVLIEANEEMIRTIQALSTTALSDVRQVGSSAQKENSVDVAIVDPPWYPDITERFIAQATAMTRPDGTILVAMPPAGTRPNIAKEIKSTISLAESLGTRLEKIDEKWLPYDAPPFEINALKAVGITEIDPQWRKADLYTFRRVPRSLGHDLANYKLLTLPEPADSWEEVMVGRIRFRIDTSASSEGSTDLASIVEGDVMPSVSRRAKGRKLANVWTSGNRVFSAEQPGHIVNMFKRMSASRSGEDLHIDDSMSPGRGLNHLGEKLKMLVDLESRELRDYGWA